MNFGVRVNLLGKESKTKLPGPKNYWKGTNMKLKHQFEWREGEPWWLLKEAMEAIPLIDAANVRIDIEEESVGWGMNESQRPYIVLTWETE